MGVQYLTDATILRFLTMIVIINILSFNVNILFFFNLPSSIPQGNKMKFTFTCFTSGIEYALNHIT